MLPSSADYDKTGYRGIMLSYKRALLVLACLVIISLLLLLRNSYSSSLDSLWRFKEPTLRQQLSSLRPYNSSAEYPAKIWQTWKYTPSQDEFDLSLRRFEESWTDLNPEFEHTIANDDAAASLVDRLYAKIPKVFEAYDSLPKPVLKADLFRYLILLAEGGIYTDIDTTALKPITTWMPEETSPQGLLIGIEADPDRDDWADWYARRIQFCQWTIRSKPGHPVLVDVVASIVEETLQRKELDELNEQSMKITVEFTGPGIWTDAVFKYFNEPGYFGDNVNVTWHRFANLTQPTQLGDVVVLPITSFSPGIGHMGAGPVGDPMAFVNHAFAGSWKHRSNATGKARNVGVSMKG